MTDLRQPIVDSRVVIRQLGGVERPVSRRLTSGFFFPKSPDGRTLDFISRRPAGYFNVWALKFDPQRGVPVGEPCAVSPFDSPGLYISPYLERAEMDVSSRHVGLTMSTVSGSVWMLEDVDR